MSRWKSENLDLESKAQLRAHRDHYVTGHLAAAGLSLPLAAFWTAAEKAVEAQIWADADADYEARKAELKARLLALSPAELDLYFAEIGIPPQDVNAWLAASPAA